MRGVAMLQSEIIAVSSEMRSALEQLDSVAPLDVPVFIRGESGTGKELAARRLHAGSPRSGRLFAAVNCAALPDSLLESELFGHTRGAFTGAQHAREGLLQKADGGTLFLDEVADLSSRAQTALLRTLQEKEYRRLGDSSLCRSNFRLVSASHKNLESEVAAGRFRHDLFFRLCVVPVTLPPLRERPADIVPLARHVLKEKARSLGFTLPRELARDAENALVSYAWPGNVRELENEMVQALVRARAADAVRCVHLSPHLRQRTAAGLRGAARDFEERLLRTTLERNGGNRTRSAQSLGLSRQGLYRKLKRLGL